MISILRARQVHRVAAVVAVVSAVVVAVVFALAFVSVNFYLV